MKTLLSLVLAWQSVMLLAQTSGVSADPQNAERQSSAPAVIERGPHHKVWERVEDEIGPDGKPFPRKRSYTELATGMHFKNERGEWEESKEEIEILPNNAGAVANKGPHKAIFPPEIKSGLIELQTPEGQWLRSRVWGLAYFDAATGESVLLAEVKESDGQLVGDNVVLYPNAFTDFLADIRYTYTRAGFEQDVVLREQPPSPEKFGLNPKTTRLQVLTEFVEAPVPAKESRQADELPDQSLGFGQMSIGAGKAFSVDAEGERAGDAAVSKQWEQIEGRDFLIEQVPFEEVSEQLQKLPAAKKYEGASLHRRGKGENALAGLKQIMPKRYAKTSPKPPTKRMAKASPNPSAGFVMDYVTLTSQANYTFRGDTTYYISGNVNLSGTNTFEGGAVLKYAVGTIIYASYGGMNWLASAYRPVVFTAKDDNSVGETIGGSTGNPSGYYAQTALNCYQITATMSYFRVAYAKEALEAAYTTGTGMNFYHGQLVNCQNGIEIQSATVNMRNLLFANVQTNFPYINNATVNAQNCTISGSSRLAPAGGNSSLSLQNCILANVTQLTNTGLSAFTLSGATNGFYNAPSFGTSPVTNTFYPFQAVGAGSYYLTNGSAFRDVGTTGIDATLLADLRKKTTWPPANPPTANPAGTTWPITAQRDTDAPDLGYHYDALDYLCSGYVINGAAHTLAAGVAVGLYGGHGFVLQGGGGIVSRGQPTALNHLVWYPSVQEQPVYPNSISTATSTMFDLNSSPGTPKIIDLSFTGLGMMGRPQRLFYATSYNAPQVTLKDCQLRGVVLIVVMNSGGGSTSSFVNLTNNFLERCGVELFNGWVSYYSFHSPLGVTLCNNTFWSNTLTLTYMDQYTSYHPQWTIKDNLFDGASISFSGDGNYLTLVGRSNNGFYNTSTNAIGGTTNLIVTNLVYATGSLGPWYIGSSSPTVVDAGSRAANLAGLYHYTTQTNQTKEATSQVDIGYHYVAVDGNGNLIDTDDDGTPDYTEDANGNGTFNAGETEWRLAILTQPQSQSVSVGGNALFTVGVAGLTPIAYQWRFNGTNLSAATNNSLTLSGVVPTNAGNYTVVVSNVSGSITSAVAELTITCLPATANWVAWWQAESNALDGIGTNHGTLQGGVIYTNGLVGNAFRFNGSNGRVDIPDAPALRPTTFTIEAWVYPTSLSSDWRTVMLKARSGGLSFGLYARSGADNWPSAYINVGGSDIAANGTAAVPLNTWTHLAATYDGSALRLYTNGVLARSQNVTGSVAYTNSALSIGGNTSWGEYFTGAIDEASLYNRALSAPEIAAIVSARQLGKCPPPLIILASPVNRFAMVGDLVNLQVTASGRLPLNYQWYFNGTIPISGATNSTLTLSNAQISHSGAYSVVVTNIDDAIASVPATLTVRECFEALDVAMVIDRSTSMNESAGSGLNRIQAARFASSNFVQQLNFTNDQAALFSFSSNVTTNQTLTNSLSLLLQKIDQVVVSTSGTYMSNALLTAQAELAGARHNTNALPIIVFLTDGEPSDSTNAILTVGAQVKNAGTRLITVALGTGLETASLNFLRALATSTNNFYHATNVTQLTNIYSLIADSICRGANAGIDVAIVSPTNGFNSLALDRITINATASSGFTNISWVQFFESTNSTSSNSLGFAVSPTTNGFYQIDWTPLYGGNYTLRAKARDARGSNAISAPVNVTVRSRPTVTITNPVNQAILGPSLFNVSLSANASASGATITNVSYYQLNGTNLIGLSTTGPSYTITWSNVPQGNYIIEAKATDSLGAAAFSLPVEITVQPPNSGPQVYAGADMTIHVGETNELNGTISDDGLPNGLLLANWSRISGLGTVMFGNTNEPASPIMFNQVGTNVLKLTGTDGVITNTDTVTIIVRPVNAAPVVDAGSNQVVTLAARYSIADTNMIQNLQQSTKSSRGKEFWLGFPKNLNSPNLFIYLSSEYNAAGSISIPGISYFTNFTVSAGEVTIMGIPAIAEVQFNDQIENKGIHIQTDNDISVYGLTEASASTDAYLALPVNAVGRNYFVLGYTNSALHNSGGSSFLIIGTEKQTGVTITPAADANSGVRSNGYGYTIVINQGQAYQLIADIGERDLSGTTIVADKPIAVFGGNVCANVPNDVAACDCIVEQLPSTNTWGRSFYTVPLATRGGGDTFQIVASANDTTVSVDGITVKTLAKAEIYNFILTNASVITANKPILLSQYAHGQNYESIHGYPSTTADPFMLLIPPHEQYLNDYSIVPTTVGIDGNFANIVITNLGVGQIYSNGIAIDPTNFFAIGTSGYSAARLSIEPTQHRFNSALPFGLFLYGFGTYNSYGYPGGMSLGAIGDVSVISVNPVVATNEVTATCFFTVGVTNQSSQPLIGVRVDFQVSGANSQNGSAFTDELGKARFYYIGTNLGVDAVRATIGTNVVTATNTWTMPFINLRGSVSDDGLPVGVTNIAWTQRSGPLMQGFSNAGITNPVVHLNEEGLYTFRLTADDTDLSSLDEVTVTVRRNRAPIVDAGSDVSTKTPTIPLIGGVSDDGLPSSVLTTTWKKISGPGSVTFGNSAQISTTATFGSPGKYVLRLTANDGQAETWDDLTVSILVDPQTVGCGTSISNNLAATDLFSMDRAGCYADYYRFVGTSNQILVLTMTATNLDSYLYLRDQNLKLLAECDDGIDGTNAHIIYVLPADGEYLIEATSHQTNSIGAYTMEFRCGLAPTVRLLTPNHGTVYTNVPETVTITAEAFDADGIYYVEFYTNEVLLTTVYSSPYVYDWLDVEAGNYSITAVAYDTLLDSSTSAPVAIVVGIPTLTLSPEAICPKIRGLSDTVTAGLRNGAGNPISGANVTFHVFGANPVTNTIATDSGGLATFTYTGANGGRDLIWATATVSGQPVSASIVERNWARQINCSQIYAGSLSDTDGTSSRIGFADYYYFNGRADEDVFITLSSAEFDTYVKLYDQNCNLIAFNDDLPGATDSRIVITIPTNANYLIEVTSAFPEMTGAYELKLECEQMEAFSPELVVLKNDLELPGYATLNFGSTNIGDSVSVSLTISNAGLGSLLINSYALTEGWTLSPSSIAPVPAGNAASFTLTFTPSTNATFLGSLTLFNNDADNGDGVENPFVLNLIGIGNIAGTPPTVFLTAPTNDAKFYAGEVIPVAATATAASGNITNVTFVITTGLGRFIFGRDTNAPFATDLIVPQAGDYTLSAAATDEMGRTTESTNLTIHILASTNNVGGTNLPPVAVKDRKTVFANSKNNIFDPRENDTDPNGDALTIIAVQPSTKATIINGGTAIQYTPPPGQSYPNPGDGFSYQISDGKGGTAWGSVIIYMFAGPIPEPWITYPPDDSYSTNAGQIMPLTATIANTPYVTSVEFYRNGALLGVSTNNVNGSFTLNWIATSEDCACGITAQATDRFGQVGTSPPRYINVTAPIGVTPPVAIIETTVSSLATNALSTETTVTVREGEFDIYGRAYQVQNSNIVWTLGLYSTSGELLRELTPSGGATTHAGNASSSNKLATCDLSGLDNGVYEIRLGVVSGYISANTSAKIRLDANLKIGQFGFSQQDLVIPVGGIPLTVVRTYNSLNPRLGDFGYGWSFAINGMDVELHEEREEVSNDLPSLFDDDDDYLFSSNFSLRESGSRDVTLTLPDGQRTTFLFSLSVGGMFQAGAGWSNPSPEVTATLTGLGDLSLLDFSGVEDVPPGVYPKWRANGNYVPYENYDFQGWELKTLDGTRYIIEREDLGNHTAPNDYGSPYFIHTWGKPYLSRIEQPSGNVILIGKDVIQSYDDPTLTNLVRQIKFERNAAGLITGISDPGGMDESGNPNGPLAVKYEYDSRDNLINVLQLVDRTNSVYATNSFAYTNVHFPHYITSMIDARGITVARNEYDDEGRLTAVTDANGKVTRFFHSTSNRMEIITDRLGYTNTFVYDLRGNVTDATNALGIVTRRAYDGANREIAVTNAFGTAQQTWSLHAYDHHGNQTNVVTSPNHTNSFRYDELGNLLWQRDSIGNVTTNGYDHRNNLTNTVQLDTNGVVVAKSSSRYNSKGQLFETRNINDQVTSSFGYNAKGDLTSTTDANGVTRSFGYDANGNQTGSSYVWTPPGGGSSVTVSTGTELDAAGRVVRSEDALGNSSRTFYNAGGKVSYTVDKFNNTNSFLYDSRGNLIQTTHADGLVTKTVYDDAGRAYLTTDRNGITGTISYFDAAGRATNVVRLLNVVVNIESDSQYPALKKSVIGGLGTPISTNATEYFPSGWVKKRIGPDGQPTTYAYWPDGQTMYVTNALNQTTFYKYDDAGRQEYVADALNRTNRFGYDALGRMITTTYANNTYTSNYFNSLGQRTVVRDQGGRLTQFGYDLSGQLTNVTKPDVFNVATGANGTPKWTYSYDAYGRLHHTIDPMNHSTTNTYDEFGREVTRWLTMGETNWTKYNALGQVSEIWDFKKQKKKLVYDRFGRVATNYFFNTGMTYPSNTVVYLYNQLGQLTNITERSGEDAGIGYVAAAGMPGGKTGRYAALLAFVNRIPPGMQGGFAALPLCAFALFCLPREKRRLLAGYIVETWRAHLFTLSASVGERARPGRSEPRPRGSQWGVKFTGAGQFSGAFVFDAGRVEQQPGRLRSPKRLRLPSSGWRFASVLTIAALLGSDPHLSALWTANAQCSIPENYSTETTRITTYAYDVEGRLAQVNSPEGVINYEYDLATGRHIRTCTQNSETAYGYDELGRLQTVTVLKRNGATLLTPEVTTYTYTAVGSRATVTLPNGVVTTWQYDNLNRLTNMVNRAADTTLLSQFSYQLHETGRRTNAIEILKTEDGPYQTNTLSWAYDGMYRLTNEVCVSTVSGASYTNQFQYDKTGNRWSQVKIAASGTTTITNLYNANDQLLKEVTLVGGTATATNNYAYDANGSLIAKTNISSSSATVLYGYDLKNKLSSATTVGTGTTNYFHYNDSGIRVQTWATGGSPTLYLVDANNHTGYAQVLEELTGLGGAAAKSYVIGDDVLAQAYGSSAASYLLYDGHGSTRQLADNDGEVTSRYNYDAYGTTLGTSTSGAPETSLLYCGEQFDENLEMYNLRARFYDPSSGRFNAMDSFMGNNDDPQSLHKYTYCHGDPVNGIDPSGLMTMTEMLVVSGIVGILAATVVSSVAYAVSRNSRTEAQFGTLIHNLLCLWYDVVYGFTGGVITNTSIAGKRDLSRPDIRFDGRSLIPWRGEVYEIKKEGSLVEALNDLAFYIPRLYAFYPTVQWRPGTFAPPPSSLELPGFPFLKVKFRLASQGVILYSLGPNWKNLAFLAVATFVIASVTTFLLLASGGAVRLPELIPIRPPIWRPNPLPA